MNTNSIPPAAFAALVGAIKDKTGAGESDAILHACEIYITGASPISYLAALQNDQKGAIVAFTGKPGAANERPPARTEASEAPPAARTPAPDAAPGRAPAPKPQEAPAPGEASKPAPEAARPAQSKGVAPFPSHYPKELVEFFASISPADAPFVVAYLIHKGALAKGEGLTQIPKSWMPRITESFDVFTGNVRGYIRKCRAPASKDAGSKAA